MATMKRMKSTSRDLYIETDEFHVLLKSRIQEYGKGIEGFAKYLGVSEKMVYRLLNKKLKVAPSEEVLARVGGRYVIAVGDFPGGKSN